MSTVSFISNSQPTEYYPLTYDLNGFNSRVIERLYILVLSKQLSLTLLTFLFFFLCNSILRSGSSAWYGLKISIQ